MSNTITDLRAVLFDTLQQVKSGLIELDRAKTVSEVAQTIINTARIEVDYAKATGADVASGFIEHQRPRISGEPPRPMSLASQLEKANKA